MKAELKLIERYEVTIDGKYLGEFKKESTWEGMSKLKGDNGVIVIDDSDCGMIESLFNGIFPEGPKEHDIVKITPELIPMPIGAKDE